MNFKHVLIVTYGRSGSTLLQRLLNSIDGCLVRGENFNACRGLFMAYDAIRMAREANGDQAHSRQPTSPWFGAFLLDEERFLSDARELLIRQLAPDSLREQYQCIGFKEVRYLGDIWPQTETAAEELTGYLEFLTRLLPECALIFLSRDHEQVVGSAWWKRRNPTLLKERLNFFENVLASYAQDKPWVYEIDFDDMIGRSPRLRGMFDFLGAPYDEGIVDQVLSAQHSVKSAPGNLQRPIERWSDSEHPVVVVDSTLEALRSEQAGNHRMMVHIEATTEVEIPTILNMSVQDPQGTTPVDRAPPVEKTDQETQSEPGSRKHLFSPVNRLSEGQSASIYLNDGENDDYCLAHSGIGI